MALEPPVTFPRGTFIGSPRELALPKKFQLCSLSLINFSAIEELYRTSSGNSPTLAKSRPASMSRTEVAGSSVSRVARIAPAEPAPTMM